MQRIVLAIVLLLGWAGAAAASDAALEDFLGPWIGQTVGETPIERRGTLLIEAREPAGFAVEWTSFEAEGDGEARKRQRSLAFAPAERAGLWRGEGENDPVAGAAAWAYIAGRTLTINIVAVLDDGRLERQIYYRTLTRDGLTLAYRRFVDDEIERALELKFFRLLRPPKRD
jgi:hypothetical protein